jgi:hypothetical protein
MIFTNSSKLHHIVISVPTQLADILMRTNKLNDGPGVRKDVQRVSIAVPALARYGPWELEMTPARTGFRRRHGFRR